MSLKFKRIFKFIVIGAILFSAFVMTSVYLFKMIFLERYKESDPQRLIAEIETVFEIDFPDDITDIRAGEFRGGGFQDTDIVAIIVAFSAKPGVVDGFIRSITDKPLREYSTMFDVRDSRSGTPDWFTTPILEGRRVGANLKLRMPLRKGYSGNYGCNIYLDISNKDVYRVYLKTFYKERDVSPAVLKELKKKR